MLERVEAMLVADEELQRRDDGSKGDRHSEHGVALLQMFAGEDVSSAYGKHHERRRQIGGRHHMREAVREARVEDDVEPVQRIGDAVAHLIARRRLHPAVGDKIQNADINVPPATAMAESVCSHGGTRFQPNSITPRNVASRKKATSTSKPIIGPMTFPTAAENRLQLMPNWYESTMPDTTPMAKDTAKILVQNCASAR